VVRTEHFTLLKDRKETNNKFSKTNKQQHLNNKMDKRTVGEKVSDNWEELKDQAKTRGEAINEHLKSDQRADKTMKDIGSDLTEDKETVKAEGVATKLSNAASNAWESTKETAAAAWEKTKDFVTPDKK